MNIPGSRKAGPELPIGCRTRIRFAGLCTVCGYRGLFGIRPDTLLGKLGLQNGDRLEAINGFEMASPEKALEAYARLRTADSLAVKVTRRGAPVTIDFKIQ